MPNFVIVDGNHYNFDSPAGVADTLMLIKDCVDVAQETGHAQIMTWGSSVNEVDSITALLITASTTASAVIEADPDSPITEALADNRNDLRERAAERRAEREARDSAA